MKKHKLICQSTIVALTIVCLTMLNCGCASSKAKNSRRTQPSAEGEAPLPAAPSDPTPDETISQRPRVHTIGNKNVLVFEKDKTLLIPVEGRGLAATDLHLTCDIQGIGRLEEGVDFKLCFTNRNGDTFIDLFYVELQETFLARCKTGDPLLITVYVKLNGDSHPVASGTRSFVLYEADDYRNQFLESHLKAHELTAFPLPEREAKDLFGSRVSRYYFAVRVALRNSSDKDRIVNIGMIRAYGRVLVTPKDKKETLFSIPVTVSPQSREHVYSIVTDTKKYGTREWIFRSFEFAGALATSIAIGFNGSEDLVKGLGVATGVADPEGKKLWPDPVPDHLKNIVNFAAPELLKVPAQGESRPAYLFFSKKELQAMVSDSTLFQRFHGDTPYSRYTKEPETRVVYLAFDNLEIPFGNLINPTEGKVSVTIAKAKEKSAALASDVSELKSTWLSIPQTPLFGLSPEDLVAVSNSLAAAQTKIAGASGSPDQLKYTSKLLDFWANLVVKLQPKAIAKATEPYNPDRISIQVRELDNASTAILSGKNSLLFETRVNEIDKKIDRGIATLGFFEGVARALNSPELKGALDSLNQAAIDNNTNVPELVEPLHVEAARLLELGKGIPEIAPLPALPAKPESAQPTPPPPATPPVASPSPEEAAPAAPSSTN